MNKVSVKYFTIIFLSTAIIFLPGCSGTKEVPDKSKTQITKINVADSSHKAKELFIDGTIYEVNGDYSNAIKSFEQALQFSDEAGIHFQLAKNYLITNKLSKAVVHSKKAIERDSSETAFFNLLADIFVAANQYDSAAVALEKIIELKPRDVDTHYKLARIYENSKPLRAVEIYEKITDLIGPDWNVLMRIAELYEQLGDNEKASIALDNLLSIDPSNVSLQKMIIDFYQRNENYEKALAMIDDILELQPDNLEVKERKAILYIAKGDLKKAAEEYKIILDEPGIDFEMKLRVAYSFFGEAIKDTSLIPSTYQIFTELDKDTTYWEIKLYLGALALFQNDDESALQNLEYAAANAPRISQTWIQLGGLLFDNSYYEETTGIMKYAIDLYPEDFVVNLILGLSYAQRNKHTAAEPYLYKATVLNTYDVTALSAYAYTLNQLKQSDEAIEYLQKALILEPDDVNLLGTLGLIYNAKKEYELTDSIYQRALEIEPDNPIVNNNYSYSLAVRGIKLDEALEMVQLAIEADSLNSSYLDTIGWVYYKLEKYNEAEKYMLKAIEVGGESAVMLDHLADIKFKLGQEEEAVELWKKALELDPSKKEIKLKIEKGEV